MTLLTPKETAERLKVSQSTLRFWRQTGKGPPVMAIEDRTFRYSEEALREYVEKRIIAQ